MPRPKSKSPRTRVTNIRLTEEEHSEYLEAAAACGFDSISEYVRHLHSLSHSSALPKYGTSPRKEFPANNVRTFFEAKHGKILWGDSRAYSLSVAEPDSVDLIVTSPPFGLVRKKSYGNEDSDKYCDWFRPFAEGFHRILKDSGSLVIDIGGAWIPGPPTRSLYHIKILVMLDEEIGFHIFQ